MHSDSLTGAFRRDGKSTPEAEGTRRARASLDLSGAIVSCDWL